MLHRVTTALLTTNLQVSSFSARGCVRHHGSRDISILELHALGLHTWGWDSLALLQGSFGPFEPKVGKRVRK